MRLRVVGAASLSLDELEDVPDEVPEDVPEDVPDDVSDDVPDDELSI